MGPSFLYVLLVYGFGVVVVKVFLGPLGELREVPSFPELEVSAERASSEWLTLGGSRVVQRGRRAHRSWSWGLRLFRPADLAWFTELASGGVVGPHYLYTSKAAVENLAPPLLQSGGSGVVANRRVLAVGDEAVGTSRQVPVLPGRAYHLSALGDGSGSVTVAADDPHALTNLATNPGFETPGATVEVRRNLAADPQARVNATNAQAALAPGWQVRWAGSGGSQTVSLVTGSSDGPTPFLGSYIRKTWTTVGANTSDIGFSFASKDSVTGSAWPVTPGEVLTWSAYIRPSWDEVTGVSKRIHLRYLDAAGNLLGATVPSPEMDRTSANEWGRVYFMHVVPAGAVSVDAFIYYVAPLGVIGVGSTLDGTGLLVEKTSVLQPYFDGSFSPDPDLTASWVGPVNASASILTGRVLASTAYRSGVGPTVQSTAWKADGTYSCRVIPTTSSSTDTWAGPGGALVEDTYRLGMQPGRTYTIAVWCRLERPLTGTLSVMSRQIGVFREGYAVIASSVPAPNEAGVHLLRLTFTVPESATSAAVRLYAGSSVGNGDVWFDNFTIVEGAHPHLMPFGQASSASAVLTPPTGARSSVTILSGDATHVTLTTTPGVGQLRLTEGTHTGFMAGDGVPPVEILDPQETLQRVIAGDHRSDFTITVKELG